MSRDAGASVEAGPDDRADKQVILMVEDEPDIRAFAGAALRQHGFVVVSAADADAAMIILRVIVPDVLFADLVTPGELDGLQLAGAARALHPAMRVVITTGYDYLFPDVSSGRSGSILRKPYIAQDLVDEVENALAA
jgi:DNA-binding NtrC family response regulator